MINWMVGVTTSNREQPTLERTLASLGEAGWDEVTVFADANCEIKLPFPVTHRSQQVGAWANFYLGLTELMMIDPGADYYFMCQDDVVFAKRTRQFCEHHYRFLQAGVVSLYCSAHYSKPRLKRQFHELNKGRRLWGALAMVFPNRLAYQFLGSETAREHRRHGINEGLKNIDMVVGVWCQNENVKYFVHIPSLSQHIGETSTLGAHNSANRSAGDFPGEDFDARLFLKK